jgi:hypothetical protein
MTKKDFLLIARIIRKVEDSEVRRAIASAFAVELASTNKLFDGVRFLHACGVTK